MHQVYEVQDQKDWEVVAEGENLLSHGPFSFHRGLLSHLSLHVHVGPTFLSSHSLHHQNGNMSPRLVIHPAIEH